MQASNIITATLVARWKRRSLVPAHACRTGLSVCLCACACGAARAVPPAASDPDHTEFEATLSTPYRAADGAARSVTLYFSYPDGGRTHRLRWRLDLLGPDGSTLKQWQGAQLLGSTPQTVTLPWQAGAPPAGAVAIPGSHYRLQLQASASNGHGAVARATQSREVAIGAAAASALAAPVTPSASALPYTIYLGNLHSQTNHSDGGGALPGCNSAQPPQSAALGPADAYAFALAHSLDFLMTSEHNHMYDGSDGSNPDADPAAAVALYRTGLQAASDFNTAHPGFVALYGQEWGVISHGGHLNIFNSEQLLGWEKNRQGQLIGDTETPRGDYAGLYHLMRGHGWIGQFNHPADDQFLAAGQPLGYTTDGDAAMVLCEVLNSNAFSAHTDQAEPRHGNFEASCNKALAAGYHVAFSSNQDNHCANWGMSYSNRTGVLIPNGTPLSPASLLAALRARRVYATMDASSQILLTANGHLMGERFLNSGPLDLQVIFNNSSGRSADSLAILHGIPGGNGSAGAVSHSAHTHLTPSPGEHFYYARIVQDDGKLLWSAPIWVTQQASPQPLSH